MGIKMFNNLPVYITQLYNNCKGFKQALKQFLRYQSFYTLKNFDFKYDKKVLLILFFPHDNFHILNLYGFMETNKI
jgi:hypothetical protein